MSFCFCSSLNVKKDRRLCRLYLLKGKQPVIRWLYSWLLYSCADYFYCAIFQQFPFSLGLDESFVDFLKGCSSKGYPRWFRNVVYYTKIWSKASYSEIPPSNNLSRNWVYRLLSFRLSSFSFRKYIPRIAIFNLDVREEPSYLLRQNGGDLIFGWLICRKAPCSDNGWSCKSHRKIMPVATYVCKTININAYQKFFSLAPFLLFLFLSFSLPRNGAVNQVARRRLSAKNTADKGDRG